jgi:phosphoenolpyruvate carboxykinase (ATP)
VQVPKTLGTVNPDVLNPRNAWADKAAYDQTRLSLAQKFINNYKQYIAPGVTDYSKFGPKV